MRYVGGHVSISGGLQNSIYNSLKIGGNCLQIFAGSPRLWFRKPFSDIEVEKFLKRQKENSIGPVFIHALYLVNLASSNSDLLSKSISSLNADIQNGALIKSHGVIIHIGSHLGSGFDSVKDQVASSIDKILKSTQNCDLILENAAGQKGKIGTLEELSYLIKTINNPRLKICLDTAHLFASGINLNNPAKVEKLMTDLRDLDLLRHLVCLHLNDCASDLGSHHDIHANLGEGKIGLEGLKNIVNRSEIGQLPLILEVPGENKQGPNLKNISLAKGLVI